jgi:hypothetical protein
MKPLLFLEEAFVVGVEHLLEVYLWQLKRVTQKLTPRSKKEKQ